MGIRRARHAVSRQELEARLFPRKQEGVEGDGPLGDWAVYNQVAGGTGQAARLLPIGLKKPNPIGLFDVIGNAAEMVQESFQLVHAGRRQGTYGGFVVRAATTWKGDDPVHRHAPRVPAVRRRRHRAAERTTGFRVALGALSAPRSRYKDLFEQWKAEGRASSLTDEIADDQDPTQLLDSIIASSADPELQGRLALVNEELKRNISLIAKQREEAAGNLIQSAALVAETINNYNIRLTNLKKSRDQAKAARTMPRPSSTRARWPTARRHSTAPWRSILTTWRPGPATPTR